MKLKIKTIHVNIVIRNKVIQEVKGLEDKEEKMEEEVMKYTIKDSVFTSLFK